MSLKLTVLWKGSKSASASPQALEDIVSNNVVQGVIQQSGRAAAVTIKRDDLEKLLATRTGGARSALQSVKDAYAEIGLMREEGVSWAEIAELLGQNGAVGRDGKPFAAATVRAAFFLVGAEVRQGQAEGEDVPPDSFAEPAAIKPVVVAKAQTDETESASGYEPAELPPLPPLRSSAACLESEPMSALDVPEVVESAQIVENAVVEDVVETPIAVTIAELVPDDEAAALVISEPEPEREPEPVFVREPKPESVRPAPPIAARPAPSAPPPLPSAPPPRASVNDMWLLRPLSEPVKECLPKDESAPSVVRRVEPPPIVKPAAAPAPVRVAPPPPPFVPVAPAPVPVTPPAAVPERPRDKSLFTHESAMSYDWWTRRIDSST